MVLSIFGKGCRVISASGTPIEETCIEVSQKPPLQSQWVTEGRGVVADVGVGVAVVGGVDPVSEGVGSGEFTE